MADGETLKLILILGQYAFQAMRKGCRSNKEVFGKITAEMQASGKKNQQNNVATKINLKVKNSSIKSSRGVL